MTRWLSPETLLVAALAAIVAACSSSTVPLVAVSMTPAIATATPSVATSSPRVVPTPTAPPITSPPITPRPDIQSNLPPQPTDTPEPTPRVLFTFTGNGSHNTKTFTLSDNNYGGFDVRWSYDCRKTFGGSGNFIVTLKQGSNVDFLMNELDTHGSGTDTEYAITSGAMHFEVVSECRWTLRVIGLP